MKKPPCIRNLKAFKNGCPQEPFNPNTGKGCPAWIVKNMVSRKNPIETESISQCIDMWMLTLNWDTNMLLEGTQQAIESFRNNSLEQGPDGKTIPKTPHGLAELVRILREEQYRRQVVLEHESRKKIANDT